VASHAVSGRNPDATVRTSHQVIASLGRPIAWLSFADME
jgi:hypothetical protein